MTRAEANAQHRGEVLRAARRQFLERGFHGATVDSIAEAAGFSRGVVYSQFGSKDEMFLALLDARIDERRARSAALASGLSGSDGFAAVACDALGETAETVEWQTLLLEFRAHAARHPQTLARYVELHRRAVDGVAEVLRGVFERAGMSPPLPASVLAQVFLAVGTGLAAELLTDPHLDVRGITSHLAGALVAFADHDVAAQRAS
jgi:AcrR family transcriptional regulator